MELLALALVFLPALAAIGIAVSGLRSERALGAAAIAVTGVMLALMLAAVRFGGHVFTQAQGDVIHVRRQRVTQRGDAVGIDRLHLFRQRENAVQLLQRSSALLFAHLKLGQFGNAGYVV